MIQNLKTQKQAVPTKSKGFTLLELLLVLALLSTLIVAGVTIYSIQLRNFKVDKTALQMQQWLQAGMAFYVDCNQWPTDSTLDTNMIPAMMGQAAFTADECSANAGKTKAYMPIGSDVNGPWPNKYVLNQGHLPSENLFYVSTTVGADNITTENIAQMIKGRLPNASWDKQGKDQDATVSVTSVVNKPGQGPTPGQPKGYIVDMEVVNSTKTATHLKVPDANTCPTSMTPVLVSSLTGITTDRKLNLGITTSKITSVVTGNGGYAYPTVTTTSTQAKDYTGGDNQVLLITACLPKSTSTNMMSAESSPDIRY